MKDEIRLSDEVNTKQRRDHAYAIGDSHATPIQRHDQNRHYDRQTADLQRLEVTYVIQI